MRLLTLLLLMSVILFAACEKEEKPVDKPPVTETVEIPMGPNYEHQYYFDLESNEIVKTQSRFNWDLAFESSLYGTRVFINGYKFMFAYNTGSTAFDSTYSYNALLRRWDKPTGALGQVGDLYETAFGEWGFATPNPNVHASYQKVYLVDRGFDLNLQALGYRKVVINSLAGDSYSVSFAELDDSIATTISIPKDNNYNKVYLSFDNGGEIVSVEPPKADWDLLFTRYTHVFYEPLPNFPPTDTLPYQVVGALSNYLSGVQVAKLDSADFASFSLADAATLTFSSHQNAIGYDWKNFTLTDENYIVDPNKLYIIKTVEDNYYKLRFVEFYNNAGTKGYPTFEVQELR